MAPPCFVDLISSVRLDRGAPRIALRRDREIRHDQGPTRNARPGHRRFPGWFIGTACASDPNRRGKEALRFQFQERRIDGEGRHAREMRVPVGRGSGDLVAGGHRGGDWRRGRDRSVDPGGGPPCRRLAVWRTGLAIRAAAGIGRGRPLPIRTPEESPLAGGHMARRPVGASASAPWDSPVARPANVARICPRHRVLRWPSLVLRRAV